MPKTTEWERHIRRNEVIELRYGEGLTAKEISERLGWSQDTIERDLREISKETAVMGEPEVLREQIITSLMLLLDHDFEDLHRATTLEDKHDAKVSLRRTLRLMSDLETSITEETSGEEWIERLPVEAREAILDAAESEVAGILEIEGESTSAD